MPDTTYTPKVYHKQGGDELVVASTGFITVEAGGGIKGPAEVVTGANTLTAAESGTTYFLDLAAGFLSTLPSPALGLWYKFVVKTAPSGGSYTIGGGTANNIFGMHVERAGGAGVAGSAEDTITFVDGQSIAGDWVVIESDGTNWYSFGMVDVSAGVTYTT